MIATVLFFFMYYFLYKDKYSTDTLLKICFLGKFYHTEIARINSNRRTWKLFENASALQYGGVYGYLPRNIAHSHKVTSDYFDSD